MLAKLNAGIESKKIKKFDIEFIFYVYTVVECYVEIRAKCWCFCFFKQHRCTKFEKSVHSWSFLIFCCSIQCMIIIENRRLRCSIQLPIKKPIRKRM